MAILVTVLPDLTSLALALDMYSSMRSSRLRMTCCPFQYLIMPSTWVVIQRCREISWQSFLFVNLLQISKNYSAIHPLCHKVLLRFWLKVVRAYLGRAIGSYSIGPQARGIFQINILQNITNKWMNNGVEKKKDLRNCT